MTNKSHLSSKNYSRTRLCGEMTRIVFVSLVIIGYSSAIDCPPGEIPDQCPSFCSYDFCPTSEVSDQIPCEKPDTRSVCPKPACKCPFNKRRDQFGSCVDIEQCPPFPCPRPNERYQNCPPYVPTDDCKEAMADELDDIPPILILRYCSPACRCVPGFWRKNGTCVSYKECFKGKQY